MPDAEDESWVTFGQTSDLQLDGGDGGDGGGGDDGGGGGPPLMANLTESTRQVLPLFSLPEQPMVAVALVPDLIVSCATVTVPVAVVLAGFIQNTPPSLVVMPLLAVHAFQLMPAEPRPDEPSVMPTVSHES
jgi:hypothetical protein